MAELTQERLKEMLDYHPATGVFVWIKSPMAAIKVGSLAGTPDTRGYTMISVDSKRYRASHLAVLWMIGKLPSIIVDHKDRVLSNDRWDNLRQTDRSHNAANSPCRINNKCGFKGICRETKDRWRAQITKDGNKYYLGLFHTPEAAKAAYDAKAIELFGEFARVA